MKCLNSIPLFYRAWMRENAARFDAVIVNGLWQFPGLAVRRAQRGTAMPYFVYTHGMLDSWFKKMYPIKRLKKSLYWPSGEYHVLRDARTLLFTCEEEKLLARQSFGLYKANEVVVSYGAAGPTGDAVAQNTAFLGRHPHLRGKRLLLFLSHIHAEKRCDLLIEASAGVAPSNPALHLVMAGPDQSRWRSKLEQQAMALGVANRITRPGILTGDVKWGAFRASEAFVMPSHQEIFGFAVAEALACGLPALISNKVNIWREIEGDSAGLVAEDTPAGTKRLLQTWLALPAAARHKMGRGARACFKARFDIRIATENLLNALHTPGSQSGTDPSGTGRSRPKGSDTKESSHVRHSPGG